MTIIDSRTSYLSSKMQTLSHTLKKSQEDPDQASDGDVFEHNLRRAIKWLRSSAKPYSPEIQAQGEEAVIRSIMQVGHHDVWPSPDVHLEKFFLESKIEAQPPYDFLTAQADLIERILEQGSAIQASESEWETIILFIDYLSVNW